MMIQKQVGYCLKEGIDATSPNIEIIYNTTVELSDTLEDKLPIATKSNQEIEQFLIEHEKCVNVFKALCLAHIRAQLT